MQCWHYEIGDAVRVAALQQQQQTAQRNRDLAYVRPGHGQPLVLINKYTGRLVGDQQPQAQAA